MSSSWVAERSKVRAASNPVSAPRLKASKYRREEDGRLGSEFHFGDHLNIQEY